MKTQTITDDDDFTLDGAGVRLYVCKHCGEREIVLELFSCQNCGAKVVWDIGE